MSDGTNGYQRYDSAELSPMPIPGNPGGYVANGSEHDGIGDTTHLPARHVQMTERRFSKLKLLQNGHYEEKNSEASLVIMPWGGSKGPAQEAYDQVSKEHPDIGWAYTMFLNPLPVELIKTLKTKSLVIVPELNYQGQFSSVLRSQGINAISITQYTGLPFKVKDLVTQINKLASEHARQGTSK